MNTLTRTLGPWLMSLWLAACTLCHAAPPTAQLAREGRARMPVVVARQASPEVQKLAATLAEQLGRIAGARFEVATGDGRTGLTLGTVGDFPQLRLDDELKGSGFGAEEQYILRSHREGLYALGATDTGAQHAAWDLLHRLGYRQFFPGEAWEVVPRTADLKIGVDARCKPDYAYRSIWYGFGPWDYNAEPHRQWAIRNRAAGSFQLHSGHAYDQILRQYKAEFDAHPEYLGLLGGRRASSKFCVSNPGLRQLVVRYALDYFKANPREKCVSVDPSDGGGWCECRACAALGSPSDRALTLANEVSAALENDHPGCYVAMYAYNQHSPPPAISARPRVIVNCATGFIRGGFTVEQIIEGWKAKEVRQFGIREYYSVHTWDRDLPGAARGSRLDYLARTIPQFHAMGARFLSAESSDNWGPNGLGYYLAARLMWDVAEASRVEDIVADFLDKAFGSGPARQAMAQFYQILNGPQQPLLSHDLLGRMYGLLGEASRSTKDPRVQVRLDHLILYTRYVELFRDYQNAAGAERQAAFERLMRHGYRMRTTMMIHAKALYRDLDARDKGVSIPTEAQWGVPEAKNPWKQSDPWTRAELDRIVEQGIASHRRIDFEPVAFSRKLVPVGPLGLPQVPALEDSSTGRGKQAFYTWFARAPVGLTLKVTGGLIPWYRDRGNVRIELYALAGSEERLVDQSHVVPPDGKQHEVALGSDRPGLHRLVVSDGGDRTEVLWPKGVRRTIEVSRDSSPGQPGRRSGYFYVPRGTRTVGGYTHRDSQACIKDGGGNVVFRASQLDGPDYFHVSVPLDQDGRLWSFHSVPGELILVTAPPFSARHPDELLLPEEVVEKDRIR